MKKRNKVLNLAIFVLMILIISTIFTFFVYNNDNKNIEEKINPVLIEKIKTHDADLTVKEKVIVQLKNKEDLERVEKYIEKTNIKGKFKIGNSVVADVPLKELENIAKEKDVDSIWPNIVYYALLEQSVEQINAPKMWNFGFTGDNIKVAVLDTGINSTHPMLQGKVIEKKSFVDNDAEDYNGHGTHVAGIAAGKKIDDETLNGVAPNALLLNAKVLANDGQGSTISVIEGINWVLDPDDNESTDDGANVLSLSLGSTASEDGPLNQALRDAAKKAVVVVSSGNCGSVGIPGCNGFVGVTTPGNTKEVITVGAVDKFDNWASFSSGQDFGDYIKPDVVAPGVDIKSSYRNGYSILSGTSMAAPHVSGVAALLLDFNENLTHDDVKFLLESTALRLGAPGKDIRYGSGLVDVNNLLPIDLNQLLRHKLFFNEVVKRNDELMIIVNSTISVNNITAFITRPDNSVYTTGFEKEGNNYIGRFSETFLLGTYKLDVFINDVFENVEFNRLFDVIEKESFDWNIDNVIYPGKIEFSDSLNVDVHVRNNENERINITVDMQIFDNNTLLYSEDKLRAIDSNSIDIFNFAWKPDNLGNRILRILALDDFGNKNVLDFNFSVINTKVPKIINVSFKDVQRNNPFVIKYDVQDVEDYNGILSVTSPSNIIKNINIDTGKKAVYEDTNEIGNYNFILEFCNSNGCSNASGNFEVSECSVNTILFVEEKTSDVKLNLNNYCVSYWNVEDYGYLSLDYLNRFNHLYYRANNIKINVDKNLSDLLLNYNGNLILEGEDIALSHVNDRFMVNVAHSILLTDFILNNDLILNFENHPILNGFNNITLKSDRFIYPDIVKVLDGYSLIDYNNGSLLVIYNDKNKLLYIPFNIESMLDYERFISNSLIWLFEEGDDFVIDDVKHDYLIEGNNRFSIITNYSGDIDVYVDGVKTRFSNVDLDDINLELFYGDHEIIFVINPDFNAKEKNYINNKFKLNVNVTSKKADVVIKSLNYTYNNVSKKTFTSVILRNIGGSNIQGVLKYYINDSLIDSTNYNLNANIKVQINKDFSLNPGTYGLRVLADVENINDDYNFDNNEIFEKIYLCYKEKILIIGDDDSGEFSGNETDSYNKFHNVLRNNGYCAELWKESEKGVPSLNYLDNYDLVIWGAGNYWGGVVNKTDLDLIKNYTGNILFEGSDILFDNRESEDLKRILHAGLRNDLKLTNNTLLILNKHEILYGITEIEIDYKISPYPDSLIVLDGYSAAEWKDGGSAIVAYNDSKKKVLYFAFGINSVNHDVMEKLILNSVEWLFEEEVEVTYGDVNFDGKVNILDVVRTINHIIGRNNFTDAKQLKAADVDFKEGITSNDVIIIAEYIVGKIKELPYEPQNPIINNQFSPNLMANNINVQYNDNSLDVDVSIKNIGNGVFYEEINNAITLTKENSKNILIDRKEKLKLNPGESKIFSYKYNNVSNGFYTVNAEIDSKSEAIESNKKDNSKEVVFEI